MMISPASANKRTLTRQFDHIILTGDQCPDISGKPISNYGLFVLKDGAMVPIPFQIDEVHGTDKNGEFAYTHGKKATKDEDKGLFDANDQLVFMARDLGDQIVQKEMIDKSAQSFTEIAVTDGDTSKIAWAYLICFPKSPVRSEIDYVNYYPDKRQIIAWNYRTEFNKKFLATPSGYAFGKRIGGEEIDRMDRAKVRINAKSVINIKRSEENVKVKALGYIDGPVRVIIQTKRTMPLVLGIPGTKTKDKDFFYYANANFSFKVDFPIKPSKINIKIVDDFIKCKGWTFYSSNNPNGHVIDGIMDQSDKNLDLSPYKWGVLSSDKVAFWSRSFTPPGCPVKVHQYFNDDLTAKDKMEDSPGEVPGIGFEFKEGWEDANDLPIEFRLVHFFTEAYKPGAEQDIVNVHDNPLKVSVK